MNGMFEYKLKLLKYSAHLTHVIDGYHYDKEDRTYIL